MHVISRININVTTVYTAKHSRGKTLMVFVVEYFITNHMVNTFYPIENNAITNKLSLN